MAVRKICEMHKPVGDDFGFIDIVSACQLSTLRYYFVHEEQLTVGNYLLELDSICKIKQSIGRT